MLLVLISSSSISFASPNFVPCDYYYYVTYDVSPKGGGTVNGYVDQTIKYTYNNIPCQDNKEMFTFAAYPSTGYGFVDWSTASSANSTSVTLSADSSYTIGANFLFLPEILNLETYSSSQDPGTQSSAPQSALNNTNLSTVSSTGGRYCGLINNNNDPYCLWEASTSYNGSDYASVLFIDNSSSCTDGPTTCGGKSGFYSNGNTTISITLDWINSTYAIPTGMSMDFVNANGTLENIGNGFTANYGADLGSALTELSTDLYNYGTAVVTENTPGIKDANNTLYLFGQNAVTASYALGDLPYALTQCAACSSFASSSGWTIQIPHLTFLFLSWQWSLGCVEAWGIAAGVTVFLVGLGAATDGIADVGVVIMIAHAGFSIYDAYDISSECISVQSV